MTSCINGLSILKYSKYLGKYVIRVIEAVFTIKTDNRIKITDFFDKIN